MTLWCRSQSSALLPFAMHPEESILWKEKRGISTPVLNALATVAGCYVRQRCAHRCSARTLHVPRTPAAPSVQVTDVALQPTMGRGGHRIGCCHFAGPAGLGEPHLGACQTLQLGQDYHAACFLNSFPSISHIHVQSICLAPELTLKKKGIFFLNPISQTLAIKLNIVTLHQIISDFAIVRSHLCF